MKKTDVRKKTRELIRESSKSMLKNLERVLNQQMIDIKPWEDSYRLPRIILQALLDEEKFQYKPLEKDYKKHVEQLYAQL